MTETVEAKPLPAYQLHEWNFGTSAAALTFLATSPTAAEALTAACRAASGELFTALVKVKEEHAASGDVRAIEEAREALAANNKLQEEALAAVPELETRHAAAVKKPKEWNTLETLEGEIDKARGRAQRLQARGPILKRALADAEDAARKALKTRLRITFREFQAAAQAEVEKAIAALTEAASGPLVALCTAFARRPSLPDGGEALIESLAGHGVNSEQAREAVRVA